jgi:tetratricopeptide (TPR) repeat protein
MAEFVAKQGLDRGKEDPGLYNILGVTSEKLNRLDDAKNWYEKSLATNNQFAPALINRANLSIRSGDYVEAREDLLLAQMYAPYDINLLVSLGVCQKRLNKYDEAKNYFTKALEIEPEHAVARYNLAVITANHYKDPATALRLFGEVLQSSTSDNEIKMLAENYITEIRGEGRYTESESAP